MKIINLDLSQESPNLGPAEDRFVVFWWQDVPLGHAVLEASQQPISASELTELATAAIANALHAYCPGRPIIEGRGLEGRESNSQLTLGGKLGDCLREADTLPEDLTDRVSIVVPTRDRPEQLKRCLRSLEELRHVPLEIIVVDNAPKLEGTRKILRDFEGVRYLAEPRAGASRSRNAGVAACNGDIIAFVDDDETVHQNWLGWLASSFAKSEVGLTTGLVLPAELASRAQQLFEERFSFVRGYAPASFNREYYRWHRSFGVPTWEIGGSGNLAIRRSVFEQLGGFDERLGGGAAGCSEDTELIYAALVNAWGCRYEPRAVTWHYHRQSMDELHEQVFSYMRGHVVALLIQYAKYRDLGNLVRLCLILPRTYLGYSLRTLRGDPAFRFSLLRREVAGCCSGLWFYWRNRRKPITANTQNNPVRTTEGQP